MKVLGIIPSRFGSVRFPGKPLIDIKGRSMIHRVYDRAHSTDWLDDLVVATDDNRILEEVRRFGGKGIMTSKDHPNGTSRCLEAYQLLNEEYDVIVNIQGDEPFLNPTHIDEVVELFEEDPETQIGTLATPESDASIINVHSNIKVVFNQRHEALYFSRTPIPFSSSAASYHKHIGIYAYRSDILEQLVNLQPSPLEKAENLEQLRWLEHGFKLKIAVTDTPAAISVDTPEDLEVLINRYFE